MSSTSNLYLLFEKAVKYYPDYLCIVTETDKLIYKQTEKEVSKVYGNIFYCRFSLKSKFGINS